MTSWVASDCETKLQAVLSLPAPGCRRGPAPHSSSGTLSDLRCENWSVHALSSSQLICLRGLSLQRPPVWLLSPLRGGCGIWCCMVKFIRVLLAESGCWPLSVITLVTKSSRFGGEGEPCQVADWFISWTSRLKIGCGCQESGSCGVWGNIRYLHPGPFSSEWARQENTLPWCQPQIRKYTRRINWLVFSFWLECHLLRAFSHSPVLTRIEKGTRNWRVSDISEGRCALGEMLQCAHCVLWTAEP